MAQRKKPYLALLLLSGILFPLYAVNSYQSLRKRSQAYVIGCAIFDAQMVKLKEIAGDQCAFLKNGDVIVHQDEDYKEGSGPAELTAFDQNGQVKWQRPLLVHHTMKISPDEKNLYALSLEKRNYNGQLTKFDKIIALEAATGKILSTWNVHSVIDELAQEFGRTLPVEKCPPYNKLNKEWGEVTDEVTHFNSINFMPKGFGEIKVIINTGRGLVLFFTDDLKLSGKYWIDRDWMANTHDVQVTEEGEILIYKNWDKGDESSLEKRSLKDNVLKWKYTRTPEGKPFKADKFGSVQFFSDSTFLFSDMDKGGHFTVVNSDGTKETEFYYPEKDPLNNLPRTFHTIRRVNYQELSSDVRSLIDRDLDQNLFWKIYKFF